MIFRSPFPDVVVPDVPLTPFVLERAAAIAEKPALVDADTGRVLTYGELADGVRRGAVGLARRGFGQGDVLALLCPNVPEYPLVFHAAACAGGAVTSANPLLGVEELAFQLSDSRARVLVTTPPLVEKASAAAAHAGVDELFVLGDGSGATPFAQLLGRDESPPGVEIDPAEDVVALPYSSGTTGLPKGVALTHRNLVANLCQVEPVLGADEREVALGVLPFFHIYGLVVVLNYALRQGGTVVTMSRFDFGGMLRAIDEHRITHAFVVPPIAIALAREQIVDAFDLSSLEFVLCGAAPLSAELELRCGERLGVVFRQGYGMTEASPVTHVVPSAGMPRPGTVGLPVPNTEVAIVDPASRLPVGPGETGEVWVRGPQVMRGYLGNPDATAATIDDEGWLHTGDIGVADEDGCLTLVDRLKELIKVNAYQVAPAELEAILLTHPAVGDAAVVPVQDEECGEVPKAFVVLAGDVEESDLIAFVAERVAPYKRVRRVEVVETIPKSPSGKILRRLLVERARGESAHSAEAAGRGRYLSREAPQRSERAASP